MMGILGTRRTLLWRGLVLDSQSSVVAYAQYAPDKTWRGFWCCHGVLELETTIANGAADRHFAIAAINLQYMRRVVTVTF